MDVDREHRSITNFYQPNVYTEYTGKIFDGISRFGWAKSGVLIGSCAKHTIIPGWSDVDILIFADDDSRPEWVSDTRAVLEGIEGRPRIGTTIDIVSIPRMTASRRVGGQPLGMLFEISVYGKLIFGENPFPRIESSPDLNAIKEDAVGYIRSDIFSWNRRYLTDDLGSQAFGDYTCKTYLRSLIRASAPLLESPFSYERRLHDLKGKNYSSNLKRGMSLAVEYRASFSEVSRDKAYRDKLIIGMTGEITALFELLQ